MNEAIYRERIRRLSPAKIDAREKRQREITRYRAAKRMAKATDRVAVQKTEREGPLAPQERVSEVLRIFRREYEALTEPEQIRFESAVKLYVVGRVSVADWARIVRSLKSELSGHTAARAAARARDKSQGSQAFAAAGIVTARGSRRA